MGSLQRLRKSGSPDMGSLQRSSSLGRAGESSLQTAARALQQREREQKLRNSPYGRPLVKSRSDPTSIRKQRYATSSSEIGSGVARQQQSSKVKKHRQRMEDEALAHQELPREGLVLHALPVLLRLRLLLPRDAAADF